MTNIEPSAPAIVWAREQVFVTSCPVSYITPESKAVLEEYHAWKLFGASDFYRWPARVVEAMFVLENELRTEKMDASR